MEALIGFAGVTLGFVLAEVAAWSRRRSQARAAATALRFELADVEEIGRMFQAHKIAATGAETQIAFPSWTERFGDLAILLTREELGAMALVLGGAPNIEALYRRVAAAAEASGTIATRPDPQTEIAGWYSRVLEVGRFLDSRMGLRCWDWILGNGLLDANASTS